MRPRPTFLELPFVSHPSQNVKNTNLQAILLGWLIAYFEDENPAKGEGWIYSAAVVLSGIMFR